MGVEVDAHDDVQVGHVGPRPRGADQPPALARLGKHDLRFAVLDPAERGGRIGHALDPQPGGREHLPRGVADVVEPEQEHAVALAHETVERARSAGRGVCTPEAA